MPSAKWTEAAVRRWQGEEGREGKMPRRRRKARVDGNLTACSARQRRERLKLREE
jgi:hypothetical protein